MTLKEGVDPAAAEAAVDEELERLKTEPVPAEELQKVKNQAKADSYRRLSSPFFIAIQLMFYDGLGDWRYINTSAAELDTMPTGLGLCILEVGAPRDGTAVYPTVVMGAPTARSLGFQSGGADALAASLMSDLDKRRHDKWRKSTVHFAKRSILLKCQVYSALAASFALACQEAASAE